MGRTLMDEIYKLQGENTQLKSQLLEEARLHGMGSEREAKLMAEKDQLRCDWNRQAQFWNSEMLKMDAELREARADLAKAVVALEKVRMDVNWMTNSHQLLNRHVFDYLDAALAELKRRGHGNT